MPRRRFELDNDAPLVSGSAPTRRRLSLIGDTPGVAIFCALLTLALAVLIFIPALPSDDRVLVYMGEEVKPTELCKTVENHEVVQGLCSELGQWEVRPTGWSIPGVVVSLVLAGLAAVVLAKLPAQIRDHRRRSPKAQETMTDADRAQSR